MSHKHYALLSFFLVAVFFFLGCSDHSDNGSSWDAPCFHPTETTVGSINLVKVIAPSSAIQIAKDLWNPSDNLDHYGIQIDVPVTVENVSGGNISLDSLDLDISRTNGKDAFVSHVVLDSSITLADSERVTVNATAEIRADKMDVQFLYDLLKQTISSVSAAPTLFFSVSDNHICRESADFASGLLTTGGTIVVKTTGKAVQWVIENPDDFADIILVVISILLKCM